MSVRRFAPKKFEPVQRKTNQIVAVICEHNNKLPIKRGVCRCEMCDENHCLKVVTTDFNDDIELLLNKLSCKWDQYDMAVVIV